VVSFLEQFPMSASQIAGAKVYEYLQGEVNLARREVDQLAEDLKRLDAEMDELIAHRGAALEDLAEHYLPTITPQGVDATFVEVRDELRAVLDRKQRQQEKTSSQLKEMDDARRSLEERLQAVTLSLNEKVALRETLEKEVAKRLAEHEEFQRLSIGTLQAEQRLTQDEGRVEEMQHEAAEKLPPYENSRLFQYLYQRRFATPDYAGRGLTKRLDRWVARLIDYDRARLGYDFLRVTPTLMAEEVTRRRREFEQHMQRLEAIEDQITDEVGLTATLREGESLGKDRDDLLATLERERQRGEQVRQQLIDLERSQGEFYHEAIDRFESFLGALESGALQRRASETPEPEDDRLVAAIAKLNESVESVKSRIASITAESTTAKEFLDGLEYALDNFRRMEFDSERSYFEADFDAAEQIELLREGKITKRALWRQFSRSHEFQPTWLQATAGAAADAIESQAGRVLMHALANVAGAALQDSVIRGGTRRGSDGQTRRLEAGRPQSGRQFGKGLGF
jgi:hypothetical protein